MNKLTNKIQRRGFIKRLWIAIGIIAGVELIAIIYNFLKPVPKKDSTTLTQFFEAGKANSFKSNSITSFRNRNFFLCRLENGDFIALSSKCTHLGCALMANTEKNLLECPCHSSMFNIQGEVLRSPATKHLDRLDVIIENDLVKVNLASPIASINMSQTKKNTCKA